MASKRKNRDINNKSNIKGVIEGAGKTVEQNIDSTLEVNYMPYAMSVIMSRALPEIDGFKPSHRKLLYTMYKMGLLNSARTKSANIVGQTMKLNPHGDAAIYDTMVRLSRGYEALLHPFVDSKGNFGKFYSRDMAWAASRYTEAKLDPICNEIFSDIDKDTVDFVDNYDNTLKEPTLLPTTFPSILVNANTGIAVGMASSICPFNLKEVCITTIEKIKNPEHNVGDTLIAPDFLGGGQILYVREQMENIYKTGRGSFKVRAKYSHDKVDKCIDITSIPPTTTSEAIIEKVIDLVKQNKIREISDIRDETGLDGLKITIDLKKGVDPEKLMAKLYKFTTLEDSFSANFNVLIDSKPRVLGVSELIDEWIKFRVECIRRKTRFELDKKQDRMHLLNGLSRILLDIDKAIEIIKDTDEESEVIPNLMIGFGIDELQADYVAEIKLRHLNREYILKRTSETNQLKDDILELEKVLKSNSKIKSIIVSQLKRVIDDFGKERKSMLIYPSETIDINIEDETPDYPVTLFFSKEGYFKKVTPQSLRMSKEQKLKENDEIIQTIETTNNSELLFFTNKCQTYKVRANDFNDTKTSLLGDFVAAKLNMDEGEMPLYLVTTKDYNGYMLFFFENGKVAKVLLESYKTKTNRKKLTGAYSDKSNLCKAIYVEKDKEFLLKSTNGRLLLVHSGSIPMKSTRSTQGVCVMSFRKGHGLLDVMEYIDGMFVSPESYRKKTLPSTGSIPKAEEAGEQIKL